jgi:hypothetical protein
MYVDRERELGKRQPWRLMVVTREVSGVAVVLGICCHHPTSTKPFFATNKSRHALLISSPSQTSLVSLGVSRLSVLPSLSFPNRDKRFRLLERSHSSSLVCFSFHHIHTTQEQQQFVRLFHRTPFIFIVSCHLCL